MSRWIDDDERYESDSAIMAPNVAQIYGRKVTQQLLKSHDPFAWFTAGEGPLCWDRVYNLVLEENEIRRREAIFETGSCRQKSAYIYNHIYTQMILAGIIALSFLCTIASTWYYELDNQVAYFEIFFTCIFWIDVGWNIYSNLGHDFFDFFNTLDIIFMIGSTVALFWAKDFFAFVRILRIGKLGGKIKSVAKYTIMAKRVTMPIISTFSCVLLMSCLYALATHKIWGAKEMASEHFGTFQDALMFWLEMYLITGWTTYYRELLPELGKFSFLVFFSYLIICGVFIAQGLASVFLYYLREATDEYRTEETMKIFSTIFYFIDVESRGSVPRHEFEMFVQWLEEKGFMLKAECFMHNTFNDASLRTYMKLMPLLIQIQYDLGKLLPDELKNVSGENDCPFGDMSHFAGDSNSTSSRRLHESQLIGRPSLRESHFSIHRVSSSESSRPPKDDVETEDLSREQEETETVHESINDEVAIEPESLSRRQEETETAHESMNNEVVFEPENLSRGQEEPETAHESIHDEIVLDQASEEDLLVEASNDFFGSILEGSGVNSRN